MRCQWRFINDGPGDPAWNMAVDEALLRSSEEQKVPVLRLYTWAPPALSFGYFQRLNGIPFDQLKRLGIIPVRRITGGRAVLHLGDLTYSIAISDNGKMPLGVSGSYRYLCRGLLAAFDTMGIHAALGSERPQRNGPNICLALSTGADIVFEGKKFVGSAQKRIGSSLLQHGSILLRQQANTLKQIFQNQQGIDEALSAKTTCLDDIVARPVDRQEVVDAIAKGFEKTFAVELVPDSLTTDETTAAYDLKQKYEADPSWGLRQNE